MTISQRELAIKEHAAWMACPDRNKYRYQGRFIAMTTDSNETAAGIRLQLLRAGAAADPMWDAIDKDRMTLGTAIRLWRQAFRTNTPVETVIKEYGSYGFEERAADGRVRRRAAGKVRAVMRAQHKTAVAAATNVPPLQRIREAMADHVAQSTPPGVDAEAIVNETMLEVEALMVSVRNRLYRLKAAPTPIKRHDVLQACHSLGIRTPKPNQPVDIKAARKAQRNMLKASHPDVGGDASVFQAINGAYSVLQAYNDFLLTTKTKSQIVDQMEDTNGPGNASEDSATAHPSDSHA